MLLPPLILESNLTNINHPLNQPIVYLQTSVASQRRINAIFALERKNKKFNTMTAEILPNAGFSRADKPARSEELYG